MLLRHTSYLEQLQHPQSMAVLSLGQQPSIGAEVSGHATADRVQRKLVAVGLDLLSSQWSRARVHLARLYWAVVVAVLENLLNIPGGVVAAVTRARLLGA
jgi:hypothetical protein